MAGGETQADMVHLVLKRSVHALELLDVEVKKLTAAAQQSRPTDIYAVMEITLYAVRNLRRALTLGGLADHATAKLCAHAEGALAKNDLPTAASPYSFVPPAPTASLVSDEHLASVGVHRLACSTHSASRSSAAWQKLHMFSSRRACDDRTRSPRSTPGPETKMAVKPASTSLESRPAVSDLVCAAVMVGH